MSVPSSGTQPNKGTLSRQCKVTGYKHYFRESSDVTDDSSREDSSTDDSSTEDSDDDEIDHFLVANDMTDSEEEFVPHETSDDDGWSSGFDTCDDFTEGSDHALDLRNVLTVLCEGNGNALSPRKNSDDAKDEEDEEEIISPLTI
ncbi:hypothetical protein PMIN06_009447 [Paraphaeosphaeria minitans]|uniref:Uncharacterized protein n=1 Tax=Paraphaeosphaeria minitans TaxID=565426 RepID=A0A9P6G4J2_9PLEO|nr:hypothetical protein PMIN01_13396 [Paraphaeosphaeria minitans]